MLRRRQTTTFLLGAVVAEAIGARYDALNATLGLVLGTVVAALGVLSLSMLVKLLDRAKPPAKIGVRFALATNFLKFPAMIAGLLLATRLSPTGLYCFFAAIGLVYCCTVWLLAEDSHAQVPVDENP